ncbi:hypothetical protein JCM16303_006077 [Sporobolomyces ruberrimus]
MNFARSCSTCVRSTRGYSAPRVAVLRGVRSFSAFSPSSPAFKKQSKQEAAEFEDDFEEDFIDDVDAPLEQVESTPRTGGGVGREQRHADVLARVQRITSLPSFRLASNSPSTSILTNLLTHSSPETLGQSLESIEQWRKKNLPLLADEAVQLLVKRLADSKGEESLNAVRILADRSKYGVEIKDIKTLYPLFAKFSAPRPVAAPSAGEEPPSDPRLALTQQASLCFELLTLSEQHTPSTTASDSFAHLSTLSIALQSAKTPSSPRIESLIAHLESLGEDYILQEAKQNLSKKYLEVMRWRAMRTADLMRSKQHGEVEWFAHLAERFVTLTK